MYFGRANGDRSHSERPARPIELIPLSIQSSSPGRVRVPPSAYSSSSSSGGARLPSTSHSSSSSSVYIRDPVDWNTRPDVLARHRQYKRADIRSSADKGRYESERRQRNVEKSQRTKTYTPRGLTLESHQYLGPVAGEWQGSASQHAHLREGFLTDYPRAYRDKASVGRHREAVESARNSAATAEEYMEEHTRYGGNFQQSDPYDNLDYRTGGSQGAGPRVRYDYRK